MKASTGKNDRISRSNSCRFRIPLAKTIILCGIALSTAQTPNTIDAVTSASGDLKLKSGKAYATEAIIVWSDHRSNGQIQTLEWGISSTSYGTPMNLKPLTKDSEITDTLKPLAPSTKYFAKFHRTYSSKNADVTTTFEFTTPATTAVVPVVKSHEFIDTYQAASIALFSANGRKILDLPLSKRIMSAQGLQGAVTPGLYIAIASDRERRPLQSFRVMVEK